MKRLADLSFEELAALTIESIAGSRERADEKGYSEDTRLALLRGMLLNFGGFDLKAHDCHCPHCDYHRELDDMDEEL